MTTRLPTPVGRQKEVLYLPAKGHTVVLGTAGSGKTTLAVLRSLYYLADPTTDHAGRVLLVTFNKCLVSYLRALAGGFTGSVDVRNCHHFARGYLNSRGYNLNWKICQPERLGERLEGTAQVQPLSRMKSYSGRLTRISNLNG
jgi:hypothetical protein